MANTKIDSLSDLIAEYMSNYAEEVTEDVKNSVDIVAKEVNDEIKNKIAFNEPTGKYRKAFKLKLKSESKYGKAVIWYVKGPHYMLTHLLENGHVLKNGGRARAFPHIKYGEELAKKRMEELAKEAAER